MAADAEAPVVSFIRVHVPPVHAYVDIAEPTLLILNLPEVSFVVMLFPLEVPSTLTAP